MKDDLNDFIGWVILVGVVAAIVMVFVAVRAANDARAGKEDGHGTPK